MGRGRGQGGPSPAPADGLNLNLTLEEFEDIVAEAIFSGTAQGSVSASTTPTAAPPQEQHPKEEARNRTAAAVARIHRLRAEGYFLH